eukprot:2502587-Rhodomonas_salina.10
MQRHYCPELPSRACVGGDAVTNLESERHFWGWTRAFSVACCRLSASEKSEDQRCAAAPQCSGWLCRADRGSTEGMEGLDPPRG